MRVTLFSTLLRSKATNFSCPFSQFNVFPANVGVIWENQSELMKYMYLAGTTTKAADHKFKFKSSNYRTQAPCKKTNQWDRNFIFINSDPSSTFFKVAFTVFQKTRHFVQYYMMGKTFEELIQVRIIQELLPLQHMWLHILSKITKPDMCWN